MPLHDHRRRTLMAAACVVSVTTVCQLHVSAQTRAETIARQQGEKARAARADEVSRAERFFEQFEEGKWFVGEPRGWYPVFGSVYPGGGLAPGAGYRRYIGYDSYIDASAMYSIAGYKRAQIVASTPHHLGDRLDLSGSVAWLDATRVAFYGLGNESVRGNRANVRLNRTWVEGAATLHLVDWLRLRLDGGVDDYEQKPGRGSAPSIERVFTVDTAPVLGEHTRYVRGEASASVVWLESPGYSRTGGVYRFAYEEFNPIRGNGGTFGFARTELVQHLPLLRETWVVSLRARTESVVRESDVVPYFLMPWLGSGTSLRAYSTGRFRDRHSLLFSGEVRWFPNRLGLDMALFADAGTVAPQRSQLTLRGMKTDYGIGMRFHTPTATALRLDLARGHEGWRAVLAASAPF